MWAPIVIEADPFGDPRLGLLPIGIRLQIDILMLERSPQALDEDVVHPAATTIHRDPDSGRRQHAREGGAGELASPLRQSRPESSTLRDRAGIPQRRTSQRFLYSSTSP